MLYQADLITHARARQTRLAATAALKVQRAEVRRLGALVAGLEMELRRVDPKWSSGARLPRRVHDPSGDTVAALRTAMAMARKPLPLSEITLRVMERLSIADAGDARLRLYLSLGASLRRREGTEFVREGSRPQMWSLIR